MIILRLLLRFILVPLGASVALWVAVVVFLVTEGRPMATAASDQTTNENFWVLLLIIVPIYLLEWFLFAIYFVLPTAVGILISEGLAIRHWIFHVFNGALSVWIGWTWVIKTHEGREYLEMPIGLVAAGIVAGFAYWAVAGWSAGFWKPVFKPPAPPPPLPPPQQLQPNAEALKPEALPRPPAAQA